jgi:hypothetical protein
MNENGGVYDLGAVESAAVAAAAAATAAPAAATKQVVGEKDPRIRITREYKPTAVGGVNPAADWVGSLSLFLPGGAHLLRGQIREGFFFQVTACFFIAMVWAILDSLHRLGPNLELLGLPAEWAVWTLGILFVAASMLYIINLITAPASCGSSGGRHNCHPVVAGIASFLMPGWGQMLSGDRLRAVPFVLGVWIVSASWILVSPATQALLAEQNMVLPSWMEVFTSPVVRWTLPAVILVLAVYGAVVRAQAVRRFV